MDPIAVDAPKVSSFTKPAAPVKPEPAKPPFPPAAPDQTGATSLTGIIAEKLGLRKNGKILAAAGCSLLVGYAAVKYFAPKPQPEASQPLVAESKPQEQPKQPPAEQPKPPAPVPSITENRQTDPAPTGFVHLPPVAPVAPASLPAAPTAPTLPPAATETVAAVPPASSKSGVVLPTIPDIAPPSVPVTPVSGVELPKTPVSVPPALPSAPTVPPVSPSIPAAPPAVPAIPTTPAPETSTVPPLSPPMSVVPPAVPTTPVTPPTSPTVLPMVPATSPSASVPPAVLPVTPPSTTAPPAALPEPSKPLTIEYTKPMNFPTATPATPDRAASTTFDVDLHEPTKTDTYATICKDYYNDAKYAAALAEYNGRRPLQGGLRVEVPPIHVLKKRYPQLIGAVVPAAASVPARDPWQPSGESTPVVRPPAGRTFTVPAGGLRMAEIAHMTLGSPTKWSEIYDLNPSLSPSETLPAGTVVKIPTESK